jgi:membrane associated rhomboid family serine protease
MRPWYRYTAKNDDYLQPTFITPFSLTWGFGAWATITLIAINCAIWLFMEISSALKWLPIETFWVKYFALIPDLVFQRHWYFQLLTSVFLHDWTSIWHLFFNMYILWMFGPRVENSIGSRNFTLLYIATGVAGSLLSLVMRNLMGMGATPSLGASSAVFGVLTAYGFLFSAETLYLFMIVPMKAWVAVVVFVVLETLFVLMKVMPNVDHFAHLGGAGAAAIWMMLLIKMKGNRLTHKWHTPARASTRHGNASGFRVIIGNQPPKEHPEGTDNEPPPDWFNI